MTLYAGFSSYSPRDQELQNQNSQKKKTLFSTMNSAISPLRNRSGEKISKMELFPEQKKANHKKEFQDQVDDMICDEELSVPSDFREDLDCPLCLKLLFEPLCTPCGHTFCRLCIRKALKNKQECPVCRAPCYTDLDENPPNFLLAKMLSSMFPKEYAERAQEVKAEREEESAKVYKLPIFGLKAIYFPGQQVNLYVFEPRYLALVQRCLEGNRRFGIHSEATVGSLVEIVGVSTLRDGRVLVTGKSIGRYETVGGLQVDPSAYGLEYSNVRNIEDTEVDASDPQTAEVLATGRELFAYFKTMMGEEEVRHLVSRFGETKQNFSMSRFGLWLAMVLSLPYEEKRRLFSSVDPIDRMRQLIAHMKSVKDDIETFNNEDSRRVAFLRKHVFDIPRRQSLDSFLRFPMSLFILGIVLYFISIEEILKFIKDLASSILRS